MEMASRWLLGLVLGFLILGCTTPAPPGDTAQSRVVSAPSSVPIDSLNTSISNERLAEFEANLMVGNPRKDGIPAIDNPAYVSAEEAEGFLEENDVIFGILDQGTPRAFPQKILVWHEIVNDEINDEKVSVTYCPLTGTAIGFQGNSRMEGRPLTLGTSGKLVNSNLVMYDRQTDSEWPQVLGIAINGPNKGNALQQFPVVWTTWGRWKEKYPNTQVLSLETGYLRDYGYDPYGSYTDSIRDRYYTQGEPFFPVMAKDARYPSKKVIIGAKLEDGSFIAIPKEELKEKGLLSADFEGNKFVAIYDSELDDALVFSRELEGQELTFKQQNGKVLDKETGSEWDIWGEAVTGSLEGKRLYYLNSFDAMWFAWYAYYPDTKIINP